MLPISALGRGYIWRRMASDTIVALSTAPGTAALAVVRMSGSNAFEIASEAAPALKGLQANRAALVKFYSGKKLLDEAVAVAFKGPRSFTGEDTIEFSFHGSNYIVAQALKTLLKLGARLAEPGEFTMRAFLNGKMDLSQSEAVADLIASETEAEHKLATDHLRGGYSDQIESLREQLIHFASLLELELDFAEEEVEFAQRQALSEMASACLAQVSELYESFAWGNALKTGIPVAIVGAPNVGKSTLLNALLNEERAIVTPVAGTTRDAIEATTVISGTKFRFIDTAGLRQTDDEVEKIGISRSHEKIKQAAVVLWLRTADSTDEQPHADKARLIEVINKSDLKPSSIAGALHISAKNRTGLGALKDVLHQRATSQAPTASHVVSNARHAHALMLSAEALQRVLISIGEQRETELLAADVRSAIFHLGSITGAISPDDLLANIFSKFCIGK